MCDVEPISRWTSDTHLLLYLFHFKCWSELRSQFWSCGPHPQGQAGFCGHAPNCPEPQPCVPGWNCPSGDSPGWMLTCSCRTTNSTSSLGRTDTASPRMLTCRPRGAVRGHCSCTGLCCRSTPPSHTLDTTFRYLGGWGRIRSRTDSGLMGRDGLHSWSNLRLQPLQPHLLPAPHATSWLLLSTLKLGALSIRMEGLAVSICFGELKHPWPDYIAQINNCFFIFAFCLFYLLRMIEGVGLNPRSCWELWRADWLRWAQPWLPGWP